MAGGDVLIICEAGRGQTESANARLLAAGVAYAEGTGGRLVCLLMGHSLGSVAAELSRFANDVRVAESPHLANYDCLASLGIVQAQVAELRPELVLFGHTYIGMDLAQRLAARLGVAVASTCIDLAIDRGAVSFTRPMYRGRVTAKVVLESRPMIATLQYGGTEPPATTRAGTVTAIAQGDEEPHFVQPKPSFVPLLGAADLFVTTGLDLELAIGVASLAKVGLTGSIIAALAAMLPIRQIAGLDPAIVFRRGAAP